MLPPEYRIAALQSDYANMREMFFGPPYYQKTRLTLKNCGSRGCSIVVVQYSAEFFSALDVTNLRQGRRGLDQLVLDPLMIAPLAIIVHEGRDGGPQLLLA